MRVYSPTMNRTVAKHYIDDWVARNYPNAIAKLSQISGVPYTSLVQIRYGRAPKNQPNRLKLCRALKLSENKLFPPVSEVDSAS
jgi:hypothetical protein